jgi:hypothetical protein
MLVDKHEAASGKPVSVDSMSADFIKKEVNGIIGFEISVHRIEVAKKLSQNRDEKNHTAIIEELQKSPQPGAQEIAAEMKKSITLIKRMNMRIKTFELKATREEDIFIHSWALRYIMNLLTLNPLTHKRWHIHLILTSGLLL